MAPNIENTPHATQTINAKPIDPLCSITPFIESISGKFDQSVRDRGNTFGEIKMPLPIMIPTIIDIQSISFKFFLSSILPSFDMSSLLMVDELR